MRASIPSRPATPLSTAVAILGIIASAGLSVIGLAPTVFSMDVVGSPQANIIAFAIAALVGAAPAGLAVLSLWRGYRWAPIAVTAAALWGAVLVVGTSDLISWISLLIAVIATVAAWLPPARQFGRDLTHHRATKT